MDTMELDTMELSVMDASVMDASAMQWCDLDSAELMDADVLNRDLATCRRALTHRGRRGVACDSAKPRALRVLVVGQERRATDEFVLTVQRWGHSVQSACDDLAAIRTAQTQRPDVVLINVDNRSGDGHRIARRLRLANPGRKYWMIGFTGSVDDERRRQCVRAGVDLLLVKPVSAAVVETLLKMEWVLVNRALANVD